MRRIWIIVFILFGSFIYLQASEGPEAFKANGCTKCHAIEVAGIEFAPGEPEEGEEAEEKEPVDLSKIGSEVSEEHILAFLKRQEVSHGNEKKHKKKFKGTDEEMQILAHWLASLK
ncbi:MAG: c-type cytochrome [Acidobacteria bacterium]|nr:c-type cytochrome [Acidobacteriota bacterium]